MNKKILIIFIISVLLLLGYFSSQTRKQNVPIDYNAEISLITEQEFNSILGVGYIAKQEWIPELYANAGIKWIKAVDVDWSQVEPNAPKDKIQIQKQT